MLSCMMHAQELVAAIINIVIISSSNNFKAIIGFNSYILFLKLFLGLKLPFFFFACKPHSMLEGCEEKEMFKRSLRFSLY